MTTKGAPGIAQRGANTWRITVALGRDPLTGGYSRIRETFHGTRREAGQRRAELLTAVAHGVAVKPDTETVAEYLARYIAHREALGKVRAKTAHVYLGYVRREVTPRIGSMRLTDLRPVHLQRVLDEAAKHLAPGSVSQVHRVLHAALAQAVRWQVLAVNPSDGVTPPKLGVAKVRTPKPAEVAKIIAATDPEWRPPVALLAATGARRGEVAGLRWSDLQLDGPMPSLRVSGTLQWADGELKLLPPKTERGRRLVPLTTSAALMLRRVKTEQTERRLIVGPAWNDSDYVFDRGDGRPIDPDAISAAFRRARKKVNLEGVRLHDLRHALATALMESGTSPRVVSDILGHSNVSFTMMTYSHPDPKLAADAMVAVNDALASAIDGA